MPNVQTGPGFAPTGNANTGSRQVRQQQGDAGRRPGTVEPPSKKDSEPKTADDSSKKAKKKKKNPFLRDLFYLILKIIVLVAMFAVVFMLVFGIFRFDDPSMQPMVKNGDVVLYYRLDHEFSVGDLVVFKDDGKYMVSRVVARSGDNVNIDHRGLVLNGSLQSEKEIFYDTTRVEGGVSFPLTVPSGSYFVLGDNRTVATDSRIVGCISSDKIEGKVVGVFRRRGF